MNDCNIAPSDTLIQQWSSTMYHQLLIRVEVHECVVCICRKQFYEETSKSELERSKSFCDLQCWLE